MSNNLFFFDSGEAPLPRDQVRIIELTAQPYPDGARVHMQVKLTPFLERPNLEIYARKASGPIVAEMSVIETMTPHLEFTLHIRGVDSLPGDYSLRAELYYDDRQSPLDTREIQFRVEPEA